MPVPKSFVPDTPSSFVADAPLTTEESEHSRQLIPAKPLSSVLPNPTALDKFLAPANEKADSAAYDPNTLRGYGARTGQALKGMASSIKGLVDPRSLPGTKENPVIWKLKELF